jgi:hypothetical protein
MNERTVRHNPLHDLQALGSLGCYMIIEDQSEADLIRLLLEVFGTDKAMMRKQLLQVIHERYNSKLTRSWINMFIHHHLDTVQTCLFLLEEDTLLSVLRAHLKNHIKTTKIHVSRKCAEFVFNGDELGFAD